MNRNDAVTATRRFGLGARPGEIERIGRDARGYLVEALGRPGEALVTSADLRPSRETLTEFFEARRIERTQKAAKGSAPGAGPPATMTQGAMRRDGAASANPAMREGAMQRQPPGDTMATGPAGVGGQATGKRDGKPKPGLKAELRRQVLLAEATQRIDHAIGTKNPLVERLVMFWSNHFAVAIRKGGPVRVSAGAFEREAIRPHVLGRFEDMVMAVEKHPAMLIYLDNATSIGPNSRAGSRRAKGLNENLAREMLELHTVGVDGGYTQADVTNVARIITGWTVRGVNQKRFEPGTFAFVPQRHEPGTWTVLGKSYPDKGLETGEALIHDLARHPATARHIARKLAAHFVSSVPPKALVASLERAFRDTGGDLAALARTLVTHEAAWSEPPRKLLPPYDFLIAIARGFELEVPARRLLRLSASLGQPLWNPPSPKGWPDDDDAWLAASAIRERLRVAGEAAAKAAAKRDPVARAGELFASALDPRVLEAVRRAESRQQGMELLIMSPAFQRR